MSSILIYTRLPFGSSLQHFFWLHPEWWCRVLCSIAWAVLLLQSWQHVGHQVLHCMSFAQELACWMLMVAAMMLPLILHRVWVTAASSLWARRHRAIAGFLTGFFVPWLLLGILISAMRQRLWTHSYVIAAVGFMVATLWQLTPVHRRALVSCHRTQPLAPVGWRAHCDCLRFGANIGIACIGTCWPLMLACALAGHNLMAIAGGTATTAIERWSPKRGPQAAALLTILTASYFVVGAILSRNG